MRTRGPWVLILWLALMCGQAAAFAPMEPESSNTNAWTPMPTPEPAMWAPTLTPEPVTMPEPEPAPVTSEPVTPPPVTVPETTDSTFSEPAQTDAIPATEPAPPAPDDPSTELPPPDPEPVSVNETRPTSPAIPIVTGGSTRRPLLVGKRQSDVYKTDRLFDIHLDRRIHPCPVRVSGCASTGFIYPFEPAYSGQGHTWTVEYHLVRAPADNPRVMLGLSRARIDVLSAGFHAWGRTRTHDVGENGVWGSITVGGEDGPARPIGVRFSMASAGSSPFIIDSLTVTREPTAAVNVGCASLATAQSVYVGTAADVQGGPTWLGGELPPLPVFTRYVLLEAMAGEELHVTVKLADDAPERSHVLELAVWTVDGAPVPPEHLGQRQLQWSRGNRGTDTTMLLKNKTGRSRWYVVAQQSSSGLSWGYKIGWWGSRRANRGLDPTTWDISPKPIYHEAVGYHVSNTYNPNTICVLPINRPDALRTSIVANLETASLGPCGVPVTARIQVLNCKEEPIFDQWVTAQPNQNVAIGFDWAPGLLKHHWGPPVAVVVRGPTAKYRIRLQQTVVLPPSGLTHDELLVLLRRQTDMARRIAILEAFAEETAEAMRRQTSGHEILRLLASHRLFLIGCAHEWKLGAATSTLDSSLGPIGEALKDRKIQELLIVELEKYRGQLLAYMMQVASSSQAAAALAEYLEINRAAVKLVETVVPKVNLFIRLTRAGQYARDGVKFATDYESKRMLLDRLRERLQDFAADRNVCFEVMKAGITVAVSTPALFFGVGASTVAAALATGLIEHATGASPKEVLVRSLSAALSNLIGYGLGRVGGKVLPAVIGVERASKLLPTPFVRNMMLGVSEGTACGCVCDVATLQVEVGLLEGRWLSLQEAVDAGIQGGAVGYAEAVIFPDGLSKLLKADKTPAPRGPLRSDPMPGPRPPIKADPVPAPRPPVKADPVPAPRPPVKADPAPVRPAPDKRVQVILDPKTIKPPAMLEVAPKGAPETEKLLRRSVGKEGLKAPNSKKSAESHAGDHVPFDGADPATQARTPRGELKDPNDPLSGLKPKERTTVYLNERHATNDLRDFIAANRTTIDNLKPGESFTDTIRVETPRYGAEAYRPAPDAGVPPWRLPQSKVPRTRAELDRVMAQHEWAMKERAVRFQRIEVTIQRLPDGSLHVQHFSPQVAPADDSVVSFRAKLGEKARETAPAR